MKISFIQVMKRVGKIIGIVVLSFFFLGVIISVFYGNEVKKMMLDELNKNLTSEIAVKEFHFSVLRHFPYASFDMKEVTAKEVTDRDFKDTLLHAEHVSLLFNIMGLFNKDFTIRKIVLKNGDINIRIDENGKNNYHFWKKSTDSTASSGVNLQKIVLDNMVIHYRNIHDRQDYLMTAKKGELSGKFSSSLFTLKTKADLFVTHFIVNGVNYISAKEAAIRSDLKVNSKTDEYVFSESTVRIADLAFDVKGNVVSLPDATSLQLAIDAHEASLQSFMSMLPKTYLKYFEDFSSKGKFYFSCAINGTNDADHNPAVAVKFSIKDGMIKPKQSEVAFENLNASGAYHNNSIQHKEMLEVPALTATLGGRPMNAGFKIEDFSSPFLSLHAAADLDLSQFRHFIKLDTLESLSGDLALNVSFAGKIKDLPRYNADALYKVQTSGTVALKDVSFKLKKNPLEYKNMNGNFSLSDNNVNVSMLKGNISSSDFQLTGVFRNFITFLLIPHQDAYVDARVISDEIDLDELLTNKLATNEEDTTYKLKFNPRLVCNLQVQVGNLHLRRFAAKQFRGEIHLADEVVKGKNLNFSSMSGTVVMDATINAARKDSVLMSCNATCSRLDITQLFYEMENFFQSTITDKNLKGKISADVQFKSAWRSDLRINSRSVVSTCDITIENGELNNFRPILALSKYLKVADLNHIKFSTMKNQIQISNRKIYIPNMEINSSVMNITCSGVHDFDNMVDYKLQLLLSDIIGKKVKDQNTEFGLVEDDGLGRTKLFLTMKGPVDDPKFGYDRKSVVQKIKSDFKADRQNLKNIIKQEFGSNKNDTTPVQRKKKEEMQIDWGASTEN